MTTGTRILVAEDDPNDAMLLKGAFSKWVIGAPVHFVCNGQEAIEALQRGHAVGEHGFPVSTLLLLDLNMPVKDGFEVLEWLRAKRLGYCSTVAVVLSRSRRREDIDRAYRLGASSYLVKPDKAEGFCALVAGLKVFWLEHSFYPGVEADR